jgi:quercetin dioxygenase-like cupin family protein
MIEDFHSVANRPGMRLRRLIATEHGFTSLYVDEVVIEQGASVPLHTHPIEEAFVVTDGAITLQLGAETVIAGAGSVVRVPPGIPHAFRNQGPEPARVLGAAAWNRATFFRDATTYLEGIPRTD